MNPLESDEFVTLLWAELEQSIKIALVIRSTSVSCTLSTLHKGFILRSVVF